MVITPTGLGGISQQYIQRSGDRLRAAIDSLVGGTRASRAADNIAALSIATQLQTGTQNLRQASINLAQTSSLVQVADGGIRQIQSALSQLRSLASQAAKNPTLNPQARAQIDAQFRNIAAEIDRIAGSTSFNNRKLLDGSLSGDNAIPLTSLLGAPGSPNDAVTLSIGNLSTDNLFNGETLSLSTQESAERAFDVVGDALDRVLTARTGVGAFQQAIGFAAAHIDSAAVNQEAATAILRDTDIAEASTQFSLASLQRNASIAIAAQGNQLPNSLIRLIG